MALATIEIMLSSMAHLIAANAIGLFVLYIGLRTDRALIRTLGDRWRLMLRALAVVWIAIPLLAIAVLYVLRPSPLVAAMLAILAICPGVPLVVRKSEGAHGNRELSLLILLETALTAVLLVPVWAAVVSRVTPLSLHAGALDVARIVLPAVVIPYAAGRLIHTLSPRLARRLATVVNVLFLVGLGLIVVGLLPRLGPVVRELDARDLLAALVVPAVAAVVGYLAGGPREDDRISVAYAAALGNPALALTVVAAGRDDARRLAIPLVIVLVLLRAIALVPFGLWLRRHRAGASRGGRPAPAAA